jgi:mRNA-degrading endonuclease RelE of RelBE toxin-antitoxin system/PHD/YefM family antitoxin component YafN of YafNO toxin-antitoxin module
MSDDRIEIPDAPDAVRELAAACEVAGKRTLFTRGERTVAVLVSWDEYLSLRETVDIAADAGEIAAIGRAEDEARRGAMLLDEDLSMKAARLRLAETVRQSWDALTEDDHAVARRALERIDDDPISGVPLAAPVQGYWSYREGHLRIVYRLVPESGAVVVLRLTKIVDNPRA